MIFLQFLCPFLLIYPALTGSKTPPQGFNEFEEDRLEITARKRPVLGTQTKNATSCGPQLTISGMEKKTTD